MATKSKTMSKPRASKARAKSPSNNTTSSSMIFQLVNGVMGDSLSDAVTSLKDKVAEQVAVHGEEYLDSAREHISEVTTQVVEWGKKHPVKTVAAAAALIAVSGFLYATLHGKSEPKARKSAAS